MSTAFKWAHLLRCVRCNVVLPDPPTAFVCDGCKAAIKESLARGTAAS